jgi:hypothetical protein
VSHLDLPQVRHNDAQLHLLVDVHLLAALLPVLLDPSDQPCPSLLFVFALPAPFLDDPAQPVVASPLRGGRLDTFAVSPYRMALEPRHYGD